MKYPTDINPIINGIKCGTMLVVSERLGKKFTISNKAVSANIKNNTADVE